MKVEILDDDLEELIRTGRNEKGNIQISLIEINVNHYGTGR